ncbi:MAG: hypothetical protein HGB03_03665 [Candidatus Yonathbacteria bacterium]|nr:hypothetical protein [Candidatus Yonathbacteria bacterium]NTW47669.1 hypothetical protein [Candidatus Yonathbacteria bacterium]
MEHILWEQWAAPEYIQKEHSVDWYWGISLSSLALIGIALLMDNILFAVFIVIAVIVVFYFSRREPHIITYSLYEDTFMIDKKAYSYNDFSSFWIRKPTPGQGHISPTLVLQEKKFFLPLLSIPLPEDMDIPALHDFFLDQLPEEEHPEHVSEKIMDRLGF